jgi:hypothetical protein
MVFPKVLTPCELTRKEQKPEAPAEEEEEASRSEVQWGKGQGDSLGGYPVLDYGGEEDNDLTPSAGAETRLALNTLAERGPRDANGHNISGEFWGSPHKFLSWNCNGLSSRIKKKDLEGRFYAQIGEKRPDIISLQEVRLECAEDDPGRVKAGSADEKHWNEFIEPLERDYDAYLSLSSKKYGGQAVLVRKTMRTKPKVSYNMGGKQGHFKSGRFIKLEFPDLVVRSV